MQHRNWRRLDRPFLFTQLHYQFHMIYWWQGIRHCADASDRISKSTVSLTWSIRHLLRYSSPLSYLITAIGQMEEENIRFSSPLSYLTSYGYSSPLSYLITTIGQMDEENLRFSLESIHVQKMEENRWPSTWSSDEGNISLGVVMNIERFTASPLLDLL